MKKCRIILIFSLMTLNLLVPMNNGLAAPDDLVILHPHTTEFADHIISGFKTWYQTQFGVTINVATIQKSSGDCYNDVETWGGVNPAADVWWGGGEYYFEQIRKQDLFERYNVTEDINITNYLGGWHLKDDSNTNLDPAWYAVALSGFGIIYNTTYLAVEGLAIPTSWDDLIDYSYFGHISMTDPDLSGSTVAIIKQILQYKCDQHLSSDITDEANVTEGWQYWLKLAGNVGTFTTSSFAVPTAVVDGAAGIGLCIDYYAYDQMTTYNTINFTFGGATTVAPDPAGILKGATNLLSAQRFMDYLTGTKGQTLIGDYRTPVNFKANTKNYIPKAFDSSGNPIASFPAITPFNPYLDGMIHSQVESLFTNWIVQNHAKAKNAWSDVWTLINPTLRNDALTIYTRLPSDCNGTIAGISDLDYKNSTLIDHWKSEAANNFDKVLGFSIRPEFTQIDSILTPDGSGSYELTVTFENTGDPATAGIVPITWEKVYYEMSLDNGTGNLVENTIGLDLNGDSDTTDVFEVKWFSNDTRRWDAIVDGVHAYAICEGPPQNPWSMRTYYLKGVPKLFQLGSETHFLYVTDNDSATFGLGDGILLNHPSPCFQIFLASDEIDADKFYINSELADVNYTYSSITHEIDRSPYPANGYIISSQAFEINTEDTISFSCTLTAQEAITCSVGLGINWSPDNDLRYGIDWIYWNDSVSFTRDAIPPIVAIDSPLGKTYKTDTINVVLSGEADHYWYYIEGIDISNQTWTTSLFRSLDDGNYVLHAYGNDSVNNIAHITQIFTIDTTPPTIVIDSPVVSTYSTSEITVILSGDAVNYWYYIESVDSLNLTWTTSVDRTLPDGAYTLHGYGNDSVGNIAHVYVIFTILTTPTTITTSTTSTSTTTTITPSWNTFLLLLSLLLIISWRKWKKGY